MSEADEIEDITNAAGTGAVDFPNGLNIAGATSGIVGITQTVSTTEPSTPSNGDTWYDPVNYVYYVRINSEWKAFLGTPLSTLDWAGDRGMALQGYTATAPSYITNQMDYISIPTTGNASDFGDGTIARYESMGGSNGNRGLSMGGSLAVSATYFNVIDYWTFATLGDAQDFGDLLTVKSRGTSAWNSNRTLQAGGKTSGSSGTDTDEIQYITVATTGDAIDFGNLTVTHRQNSGTADATRAIFGGGHQDESQPNTDSNSLEYVTISTTGNGTDFGDLLEKYRNMHQGVGSDGTNGFFIGGYFGGTSGGYQDVIQTVVIQTTGNATDFGDLTRQQAFCGLACNDTYAVKLGGYQHSQIQLNEIDRWTMATAGNASDFGDLVTARSRPAGVSGNAS